MKRSSSKTFLIVMAAAAVAFFGDIVWAGEIHDAAKAGDVEKVKALLKANPDLINSKDDIGRTPLHVAASAGRKEVTALLLTNKADVSARDKYGGTPLHWAAGLGRKEVAELLLANKAEVDAKTADGRTPLHNAAIFGRTEMAELLLVSEAEVNAKDKDGKTPLAFALEWRQIIGDSLAYDKDVTVRALDETIAVLRAHGGK